LINALADPDPLGILPPTAFWANATVYGPCSQTNWTLTLTNLGAAPLDWSLGGTPAWLNVSSSAGTLEANGSANIALQLVNPNALPADDYRAVLAVTNLDLSRVQDVTIEVAVGQSILQNGGFETGDFTGWTLTGDTAIGQTFYNVVATDAEFPGVVHSGYFGAMLGENGYAATLSQALTTVPGQQYLLSFWLNNSQGGNLQSFSASWDGTNLINFTNPPAFTWSNFQFVVTADDTNALLEFDAENDPHYFGFDDVSVVPVPPVAISRYWPAPDGFYLAWPSLSGLNYQVQYTTNLVEGNWLTFDPVAAGTNMTTFGDTNAVDQCGQRFYRLVLVP
jgi:hypothetical protein